MSVLGALRSRRKQGNIGPPFFHQRGCSNPFSGVCNKRDRHMHVHSSMASSNDAAGGDITAKCVPCEEGEASGLKVFSPSELKKASSLLSDWIINLKVD